MLPIKIQMTSQGRALRTRDVFLVTGVVLGHLATRRIARRQRSGARFRPRLSVFVALTARAVNHRRAVAQFDLAHLLLLFIFRWVVLDEHGDRVAALV